MQKELESSVPEELKDSNEAKGCFAEVVVEVGKRILLGGTAVKAFEKAWQSFAHDHVRV